MDETTPNIQEESEGDSGSDSLESESEVENEVTDRELQNAFSKGVLQPGLNFIDKPAKECANDMPGMKDVLQEFEQDIDWIERLDVTCDPVHPPEVAEDEKNEDYDVEDYFKRELRFYRQAQAAVLEALPKLNKLDVQTRRPDDYFAEMAKSDAQMKKIREKLLKKQMMLEKSEKAKKLREMRKFGKKVQQEVLHARQKEKTEMTRKIKKISKGKMQETGDELKMQQEKGKKRNQEQKGRNPNNPLKKVNKKREYKNAKFGFGGKTRRMKFNDRQSNNAEDDGFDAKRNNRTFSKQKMKMKKGFKRGAAGGSGGPAGMKKRGMKKGRPGKNRRKTMKSRRK